MRNRLPKAAGFAPRFAVFGHDLRLTIPAEALAGIDRPIASFFPFDGNVVDAAVEPKQERRAGGIELSLARLGGPAASLPATLAGVSAGCSCCAAPTALSGPIR